ncbi:MAG: SH3 domain-containing C40 family peptidase [Agathobacter sp.]|nr:SH3 domain-containing C40 family peptidase [Agathobacter sp.]
MKKRNIRLASLLLSSTLLIGGTTTSVFAAGNSDSAKSTTNTTVDSEDSDLPLAGVTRSLLDLLNSTESVAETETEQKDTVKAEKELLAVAQVNQSVYVRKEASTKSEYVGRLYNNNVATVLETLDGWYKIKSGNVKGYVSADYVVVGDEDLLKKAGTKLAEVKTETLRVRKDSSEKAGVVTLVAEGQQLKVKSTKDNGWVKIKTDDGEGYVSSDYVSVFTKYTYGETKKEEQARLAKEAAERENNDGGSSNGGSSNGGSSNGGGKHYNAPNGMSGQAVANFACQFVGRPYKWGGSSLTNGADCSGFVMAVYAKFGVSLPHSSGAMRSCGYGVSKYKMQPGDIVCFPGHVGIYIGGGTMVDANSSKTGIKYTAVKLSRVVCARRIF